MDTRKRAKSGTTWKNWVETVTGDLEIKNGAVLELYWDEADWIAGGGGGVAVPCCQMWVAWLSNQASICYPMQVWCNNRKSSSGLSIQCVHAPSVRRGSHDSYFFTDSPQDIAIHGLSSSNKVRVGGELVCTASGYPTPNVSWTDWTLNMTADGQRYSVGNETGSRNITCTARNVINSTINSADHSITITVTGWSEASSPHAQRDLALLPHSASQIWFEVAGRSIKLFGRKLYGPRMTILKAN